MAPNPKNNHTKRPFVTRKFILILTVVAALLLSLTIVLSWRFASFSRASSYVRSLWSATGRHRFRNSAFLRPRRARLRQPQMDSLSPWVLVFAGEGGTHAVSIPGHRWPFVHRSSSSRPCSSDCDGSSRVPDSAPFSFHKSSSPVSVDFPFKKFFSSANRSQVLTRQ